MNRRAFYLDLLERVGWTAVQAAAGALLDLLGSGEITWRAVGYAALAALLKSLLAPKLPWTAAGTASTLPASVDPPDAPHAAGS